MKAISEASGVDVEELVGALALVAQDLRGWIEVLEEVETEVTQDTADGRERQEKAAGDTGEVRSWRRSVAIAANC